MVVRGVVATVEFLQHRLSEMSHRAPPPVTLRYPYPADRARFMRSVRRASGLVLTAKGRSGP